MSPDDTMTIPDEKALVLRSQRGDEGAFAELMRAYGGAVMRYVSSIVRDSLVAEDVAQETFLRAFKKVKCLRDADRFRHWLFKIARCAALDHVRREDRWVGNAAESSSCEELDDYAALEKADEWCRYHTLLDSVRDAVRELPEDAMLLVRYRYSQSLSYEEIADLAGMTVVQAKGRLARAREKLRGKLETAVKEWRRIRNELP